MGCCPKQPGYILRMDEESADHNRSTKPAMHTNQHGEVIREGDVVRINDDSPGWTGDCGLTLPSRRQLAKVVKPGPICILELDNGEIKGCIDTFITVVN